MRYCMIMMITTLSVAGCFRVAVDPIEVKPITLNINLKVDRELDDFFAFEKKLGPAPTTAPTTLPVMPATQPMAQ